MCASALRPWGPGSLPGLDLDVASTTSFADLESPAAVRSLSRPRTSGGNGAEFRQEERREFRYLLSVTCAVIASWCTWLTPERLRYWIADRLGDVFYRISPTYRKNVRANLEQALGPAVSEEELTRATKQVFRTSGRNFADLLTVPHKSAAAMISDTIVSAESLQHLDSALARGKGVLLLSGHLGAFDLMGQVLHQRGYKLTVVTGRTTSRFLFDSVTYLRRSRGLTLVEATPSGVRRAIQAVRRGEVTVFVSDRDFFQNGRPIEFFGRATTLPPGVVRIARDTGATIVPLFAERFETGHGMRFEEGFTVTKTADLDADLGVGLDKVRDRLERGIAKTPDQWVMFQRVWPLEPATPVRVFPVGSPLESELLERVGAALPSRRQADSR